MIHAWVFSVADGGFFIFHLFLDFSTYTLKNFSFLPSCKYLNFMKELTLVLANSCFHPSFAWGCQANIVQVIFANDWLFLSLPMTDLVYLMFLVFRCWDGPTKLNTLSEHKYTSMNKQREKELSVSCTEPPFVAFLLWRMHFFSFWFVLWGWIACMHGHFPIFLH